MSEVVRFSLGGSYLAYVGHSHYFPLIKFIIFHVSILLILEVDVGVSMELGSAPKVLELSAKAICRLDSPSF